MDKKIIMYQLFLRMFTKEGTIAAAEKRLEHVKKTGINCIYICPFNEADDCMEDWSERQKKSGMNNPKNPYRIKDFFKIDEEYGNEDDLKSFVKKAHSLGMNVLFDLVYMHCGPNAVFITENPDFVKRDENNNIMYTSYHFPIINFENDKLREYLMSNMEYFIKEFDVDGFRCDVGDAVPLDFWREAKQRMQGIKKNVIMLNEGMNPEYLSVFDWNYSVRFNIAVTDAYAEGKSATEIKDLWKEQTEKNGGEGRCIYYLDNHDIASDSYSNRYEKRLGHNGMENVLFMIYTLEGTPMLYNGNEICDEGRHSLWSNRFHGGLHINWEENAESKKRLEFLQKMAEIRNRSKAVSDGKLTWVETDNDENMLVYIREYEDEKLAAVINIRDSRQKAEIKFPTEVTGTLIGKGISKTVNQNTLSITAEPYAYELIELK